MIDYLDEWLARKRDRPQLSIREARSARFRFVRALGPRGHFAVVYLRAEPAMAEWPSSKCDHTVAVLDGILDEVFATDLGHVAAKVGFILEKIEYHEVDSCNVAFYHAARGAVREILGRDAPSSNIDYGALTRR